jgi:hypothetical protein
MATSQQRQQLAKKRKKDQQEKEKLRNTIVRHYTKPHWVEKILSDGEIKLEGANVTKAQPNYNALMLQYKLVGRYVWFTESSANSIVAQQRGLGLTSEDLPYFEFSADSIKILRWTDIKKLLEGNALLFAKWLEDGARANGDDPNKWWVSKRAVSLDKVLRIVKGTELADKMMNPYETIFKVES